MDNRLGNLSDKEILGLTIIGESRGEPIEGQVAVGSVIRNRLAERGSGKYFDVCLAHEQFSCWNPNDSNYPYLLDLINQLIAGQELKDPHLRQCLLVAAGIVDFDIVDNTDGATHYLTNLLISANPPSWAAKRKREKVIGNQTFFNI